MSEPAHDFATNGPRLTRPVRRRPATEHKAQPFSTFDRVAWVVIAALSTMLVWLNDGFVVTTGLWFLVVIAFSQIVLPQIFRRGHNFVSRNDNLYVGVIFGWVLVPGPVVGVIFGTLLPLLYDFGLSSYMGGLIGLIVGPCLAVIQGLVLVSIVDLIVWIATGTSLSKRAS